MKKGSVLFVKLGALGDVIMALPAVKYLEQSGYQVTWMVGMQSEAIVSQFSSATKRLVVDDGKILKGGLTEQISEVGRVNLLLAGKKFDSILIGNRDSRYRLLAALARGPIVQFSPPHDEHHVQSYLNMAMNVTGETGVPSLQFWPPPIVPWGGQNSKLIALAPGGAKNLLYDDDVRRWPIENYVQLAKLLLEKGYQIHLIGGPSDSWVRSFFKDLPVEDFIGQWTVVETIANLSKYRCLVTHDSGPLHFGGLAQVPVYGIFGPTLPSWRFPIANSGVGIVLDQLLSCQPCYDGRNFAKCSHKNCMVRIDVERVLRLVLG